MLEFLLVSRTVTMLCRENYPEFKEDANDLGFPLSCRFIYSNFFFCQNLVLIVAKMRPFYKIMFKVFDAKITCGLNLNDQDQ